MSDPDRYRWRRKAELCAVFHISNSTVDREVKRGGIEKMLVGRTPMFRWRPEASEGVLTLRPPAEQGLEVNTAVLEELRAIRILLQQTQQVAQTPDAARPWWESWSWREWWRKRVSKKEDP